MDASIYIADTVISYVLGERSSDKSIIVSKCKKILLEDGIVVRGKIQNLEVFKERLLQIQDDIKGSYKNLSLLLDGYYADHKIEVVPILSNSKMIEIVKSELTEFIEVGKEYFYDYSVLEEQVVKGKSAKIMCAAIEKQKLNDFIDAFQNINMPVSSVDFSISGQILLTDFSEECQDKTYILGILEGNHLDASLYVQNRLVYSNRVRIQNRENLGLIAEMTRFISTLIQFNQSQKNDTEVEAIYLCGMRPSETAFCSNLTNSLGRMTTTFPDNQKIKIKPGMGYQLTDYFCVTGNLLRE